MQGELKWVNKLSGTRLLIIGGTSGIGFGVAEASVEHGVSSLILSSSSKNRLKEAIHKIKKSYPDSTTDITTYQCDLSNESKLSQNVQDLFSKVGIIDHIVFTAGDAPTLKPFAEVDFESIQQTGMVRFFAPLLVARYGYKNLSPSPKSSIILTSGVSSEKPIPGWTVTSSYLSGLHGMMRGLAFDLKPIRVNLVVPGGVDTEMWNILDPQSRATVIEELERQTTTGQIGTVESVVEAYLYCMKDYNLTGSTISTNGGRLLI
ncbi:putative short-chain dehydrogenases/reductase [Talaromyces proteolyticus]|uniref:Short-chain dehydrogenases/reductase n=1 Tax=Talaromyces proteolyticus TaxID=1131652 RepID=A0AAD4KEZ7_9EURO|nr:putative short-chain dehydrogenases/reductase [Talaromyces proteolyticus]KAH8688708.1 putative short-chain dehydrogenases/reductase [Talaromyces proteolyticus]